MNQIPSDRELAQLFAQTRAQLADRARREVNRVNTDLDQMLTKIRQAQAADEHYQSLSRADRYPFTYTSLANASDSILDPEGERENPPVAAETTPSEETENLAEQDKAEENPALMTGVTGAMTAMAISRIELEKWGIDINAYAGLTPLPQLEVSPEEKVLPGEAAANEKYTLASIAALFPVEEENLKQELKIVLTPAHLSDDALMILRHLVKRTGAKLVLGGVKALLPGEEPRVRNSAELHKLVEESETDLYLLVVDSPVPAHQRTLSKIMQDLEGKQAVALVDGENPQLPESTLGLEISEIIALNLWENPQIAAFMDLPPAILLDTAPASARQWELVLEYQLRKTRGYR